MAFSCFSRSLALSPYLLALSIKPVCWHLITHKPPQPSTLALGRVATADRIGNSIRHLFHLKTPVEPETVAT
jgi:hypothetical protein